MHHAAPLPHGAPALGDINQRLGDALRKLDFLAPVGGRQDPLDGLAAALAHAERDGDGQRGAAAGEALLLPDLDERRDAVDYGREVFDWVEREGGARQVRCGLRVGGRHGAEGVRGVGRVGAVGAV